MKRIITGIAAIALVAGIVWADTTDVKTEAKAVGAQMQGKVDSAKAGIKADMTAKKAETEKWVTSKTGLKMLDTKVGTGTEAKVGMKVLMHYTGWLWEKEAKGKQFDSSRDRNEPYPVVLGRGGVIAGWEEGILGMKEGGQRTLIIPPDLAYGTRGFPGAIPPNATLIFELEFVKTVK